MASLFEFWLQAKLRLFRMDRSLLAGTVALLCALGLTLLSAGFVFASVSRMHAAFGWVQHTDSVILQMVSIEKNLLAADATTRAQLSAGANPNWYDVKTANDSIMAEVKNLASLVADNPEQTRRTRHLQATIAERAMARVGPEGAEFHRMSAIRAEIQAMLSAEWKLLETRTAREAHTLTASLVLATLTGVLAFVLGALGGIHFLSKERARRRHIELELMRIQRLNMMSLTTMALAHEINQPLAAASNYLACSLRAANAPDSNDPDKMVHFSTRALEQVQRAGDIIKRMRSFIEKSEGERTIESPRVIIDDAISLIGTIDGFIKIERRIGAELPCVSVDKIQMQQVLVNLIRNSIGAFAAGGRNELILSAVTDGPAFVRFAVADNGPGLPKSVQENLFKPFEPANAGGVGVGLLICKAIVTSHGGQISASSGPEGGTIISFTLPAVPQKVAA